MTYIAWVSTEGGGPPPGALTWYFGEYAAGGLMPGGANAASTARDEFVARLVGSVTWEDWGDDISGPWGAAASMASVDIVRNGVIASFPADSPAITAGDNNGRFNTDPVLNGTELLCEVGLTNETGSVSELVMTFSPSVAAWGSFITDLGDFSEGSSIALEITKSTSGTESYTISTGSKPDGMLTFIGFVDDSGTTYSSIRIHIVTPDTGAADGIGLDDVYWCDASYIA